MIFLDVDPYKAAESLCDKHIRHATPGVIGQTLTAILKSYNFDEKWFYEKGKSYTMKHPLVRWGSLSRANYLWLLYFYEQLFIEFNKRYHKSHKSEDYYLKLLTLNEELKLVHFPKFGLTLFPVETLPLMFSAPVLKLAKPTNEDIVQACREHYWSYKYDMSDWEAAGHYPEWWPEGGLKK